MHSQKNSRIREIWRLYSIFFFETFVRIVNRTDLKMLLTDISFKLFSVQSLLTIVVGSLGKRGAYPSIFFPTLVATADSLIFYTFTFSRIFSSSRKHVFRTEKVFIKRKQMRKGGEKDRRTCSCSKTWADRGRSGPN